MKNYLEARREELRKRGDKGFTLMEMLIVVAIIAVLIAIAIPVFTSQLEKSREATVAANMRSAYAELMAEALLNPEESLTATVEKKQQVDGWENDALAAETIGGVAVTDLNSMDDTTITYTPSDGDESATYEIDGNEIDSSFID